MKIDWEMLRSLIHVGADWSRMRKEDSNKQQRVFVNDLLTVDFALCGMYANSSDDKDWM